MINISMGGTLCLATELQQICASARDQALTTVVACIGNNHDHHGSPGNLPEVLGVGATMNGHKMLYRSASGLSLCGSSTGGVFKPDLVAPGRARPLVVDYSGAEGTSLAAPIVTATVAFLIDWIWSNGIAPRHFRPPPVDIRALLDTLLVPVVDDENEIDRRAGKGREDLSRFKTLTVPGIVAPPTPS